MLDYISLIDYGVEFKHLISGPAPVGRILNYLILVGKGVLKHKNGNRDLTLKNNVASAWCTEFMVGLGLVNYEDVPSQIILDLYLTEAGKSLYDLIKDFPDKFDEAPDPSLCKTQLEGFSKKAYYLFFNIFKSSAVCENLCRYIYNAGTNKFLKSDFKDDYFECFKTLYEGGTYNRNSRTTTGDNRVPSLLQISTFFDCMEEDNTSYIFDYEMLNKKETLVSYIPLNATLVNKISNEEVKNEKLVKDLVEKYGIDGTVAREIVVRNSTVQSIFRNNLIAKYGCKCAICGKSLETVIIASHIVPSSECNVIEKADCENGLLLCALHDKLFDKYLISFDFITGKLLYSKDLETVLEDYQLIENFVLDDTFLTDKRREYLLKHNMEFYERNK